MSSVQCKDGQCKEVTYHTQGLSLVRGKPAARGRAGVRRDWRSAAMELCAVRYSECDMAELVFPLWLGAAQSIIGSLNFYQSFLEQNSRKVPLWTELL